jgi:hypothetical protein
VQRTPGGPAGGAGRPSVRPEPARPGAPSGRVERWWFRIQLAGEDLPLLFYTDDQPDLDFDVAGADPVADLETWRQECAASRAVVVARGLDDTGTRKRDASPISLRFVLAHMLAEYARHNGHADLLRERIDGATGV